MMMSIIIIIIIIIIIMNLHNFNLINYKWKLHPFKITNLDIVSRKTF